MKDKILVTGAAGFIGSHLVDYLLRNGVSPKQLTLLLLTNESLENLPNLPFRVVRGDIRDKAAVSEAMENVTIVYHLAARIDFDGKTYEEYEAVNVTGTQNLLDLCELKPIKKFIFYSTIGVFGLPASIGSINNWDETHPKTYTNFYGQSKWEAELRVMAAHKKFGLPYVIIRPASVYGPREKGPTLALYRAIKHHQFLMVGNGQNLMHYVYVGDLVRATYRAAQSKLTSGDFIIAGNQPTSFSTVVRSIANSIGVSVPALALPVFLALFVAYVAQFLGTVFGFKPPIFPSRVRTMTTTYYYSIEKARKVLGYKPLVSFTLGSQITGAWYSRHGWLK